MTRIPYLVHFIPKESISTMGAQELDSNITRVNSALREYCLSFEDANLLTEMICEKIIREIYPNRGNMPQIFS